MILYITKPKNSTPKLLDTIKHFNNVAGYKINFQRTREKVRSKRVNLEGNTHAQEINVSQLPV
jgi:hypothetical protein